MLILLVLNGSVRLSLKYTEKAVGLHDDVADRVERSNEATKRTGKRAIRLDFVVPEGDSYAQPGFDTKARQASAGHVIGYLTKAQAHLPE